MNQVSKNADDIVDVIGQYLATEILRSSGVVDPEQNLLLDGAVDSLGMLKLVAFIELSYEVRVPPEHFTIENFRNLRIIGDYVSGLLA